VPPFILRTDVNFQKDIANQGLSVILASNPRNPTGQCIKGDNLKELVELHKLGPTVILDEFYSWYIYHEKEGDMGTSISAASYIDGESHLVPQAVHSGAPGVNEDPVILIDGLIKNFRYAGPYLLVTVSS